LLSSTVRALRSGSCGSVSPSTRRAEGRATYRPGFSAGVRKGPLSGAWAELCGPPPRERAGVALAGSGEGGSQIAHGNADRSLLQWR
jgi:hypothetical protein